MATILKAIEVAKQSEQWQKENGKFIPFPATWLDSERWLDESENVASSLEPWAGAK